MVIECCDFVVYIKLWSILIILDLNKIEDVLICFYLCRNNTSVACVRFYHASFSCSLAKLSNPCLSIEHSVCFLFRWWVDISMHVQGYPTVCSPFMPRSLAFSEGMSFFIYNHFHDGNMYFLDEVHIQYKETLLISLSWLFTILCRKVLPFHIARLVKHNFIFVLNLMKTTLGVNWSSDYLLLEMFSLYFWLFKL